MASVPLGSHLKRYKLATSKLVEWLVKTARKVSRSSGESLRLGKELTTKDLVWLAEYIASAKPAVAVTAAILTATADVIKGRTFCANFFQQLGQGGEQSSNNILEGNRSHRHFISVLEKVQSHLRSLKIAKSKSAKKQSGVASGTDGKRNLFDMLQLEEPDDTVVAVEASASGTSSRTTGTAEASDDEPLPTFQEDKLYADCFAIWCAFQDMREIRLQLQGVWRRYYDGKISFLVASHTTEAAFKFLRDIDIHQLGMHSMWSYDGFQGISEFLGFESGLTNCEPANFMYRLGEATPTVKPDDNVPPAELFCVSAWTVMQDFRLACGAHRDWQGGVYAQLRLSSHPLAALLRKCEPTIRFMADRQARSVNQIQGFVIDYFTEGMTIVSKTGLVPIWCVAQTQILMDILEALGTKTDIGHKALHQAVERGSVATRMKTKFPGMESHPLFEQLTNKMNEMKMEANIDTSSQVKPECLTGSYSWPQDRQPEELLSVFPLLAGSRLRHIVLNKCIDAVQDANDDLCVLGAAYIYKAAQCSGLLRAEWPDMEALISSQEMHGQFVRTASTLEGYARHFDMAIGVPLTTITGSGSRRPLPPSGAVIASKRKKLQIPSSFVLSMVEVQNEAGGSDYDYSTMLRTAQRVYSGTTRPGLRKNFTPLEIIKALEQSLTEDEVAVKFDYTGFHAKCLALLNTEYLGNGVLTANILNADLKDPTGYAVSMDMSTAAELVHTTLWEAADLEKSRRSRKEKLNTTLASFAHTIQNTITFDGTGYLSPARDGSSGHIPEKEKPCNLWKWGGERRSKDADKSEPSAEERAENAKINLVCNGACAKYREWLDQDWTTEQRLRKTTLWADKEFTKGGHNVRVKDIVLIPENEQIIISLRTALQEGEGLKKAFERVMKTGVLEELPELLPCD